MNQNRVINRIPGDLQAPSKKENQGYVDDLGKKEKFELEELLERQNKILANRRFASKLPDKGEKIKRFRDQIIKELERKNEVERAANLLSRLNLASEGKAAMNELEWTGKYSETANAEKIVELDSDDEEDPLKILAQPTGTGVHKKKIVHLVQEKSLIRPEDLAEIESFKAEDPELQHVKYLVEKVEKSEEGCGREPFKPYKTTKSNVHDPDKEKERKQHKHWEVTAATPPLILHGAARVLNLNESLALQKQQAEKLQEVQAKHAAEKLAEQLGLHAVGTLTANAGNYRLQHGKDSSSSSSSEDEEEHEVHDDEDHDKRGTVVFTAIDIFEK